MQFHNYFNQFRKMSVCLFIKNFSHILLVTQKTNRKLGIFPERIIKIILGKNVLKHKELRPMFDEFIVCSFDFECKHSYFSFLNIFCGPIRYSSDLKMDPLISKMSAAIMHASHNLIKIFLKSNVKAQIKSHNFASKLFSFKYRNHTAYF